MGYGPDAANKYITTYFRQTFISPDPSTFSNLVLRLVRDDGAVVYLNGVEVFRSYMPTGAITHLTLASTSTSTENAFRTNIVNATNLVEGVNILGVEVHQSTVDSSDLSFDLELTDGRNDTPIASITNPANNSTIPNPGNVTITVSAVDPNGTITNAPFTFIWTNVSEGTHVINVVARDNDGFIGLSPAGKFTVTAGSISNFTHIAAGSVWKYHDQGLNLGTAWSGTGFDDSTWTNGPAQFGYGDGDEARVLSFGTNTGNKYITTYFRKTFPVPDPAQVSGVASGTPDYYSFDHANIHFVCLDSMISSRSSTGAMAQWLTNDLAGTTQTWLVAFWHHPPYTKGSHNSDTESELVQMRQNLLPHLENYGVDLVLTGHSHAYERSHLLDRHYGTSGTLHTTNLLDTTSGRADVTGPYLKSAGTAAHNGAVYVVAGTAGKASGGSLNHPAMFFSLNRLGSLYFEVSGDRLDAQFVRETGVVGDYFTILKDAMPYRLVRVGKSSRITWNTVLGETYLLDYKDDVSAVSWTSLGANITGTGLPVTVTNNAALAKRFYRIRTQ